MQLLVNDKTVIWLKNGMSMREFYEFCALNSESRIERTAAGDIVIQEPAGGETSGRNMDLTAQLEGWSRRDGRGVGFASCAGFVLPNTAIRSPDASWVLRSRLERLTRQQKERFLPVCPDFVVELTSPSDRLGKVQGKMREWMANGASLGWILDAKRRRAHIYTPDGVEVLDAPKRLAAGPPVNGFVLDLKKIWDPAW